MKKNLAIVFCFLFIYSQACECPPLDPLSKKSIENYDVIFHGTVDSIIPCSNTGIGTVFFTIIDLYKGAAERYVSIDYDCTSACMMSFSQNEEWIIYSTYQRFDLITVSLCSHTRKKIPDGSPDFYQISSGRSFAMENDFLKNALGIQPYSTHNEMNDRQKQFQPRNEQPNAMNKFWLLLVSALVMILIYIVSKNFLKK